MSVPSIRQTVGIMGAAVGLERKGVAMSVTIERTSAAELHKRLSAVLAEVEMTETELADLAAQYLLTAEELAAWDEVRAIRFLLGNE